MWLNKISNKFNLLSIFLILLTAFGTGGFIVWHHQTDTLKTFNQHGQELAQMLAKNIEYGVYTENQQTLRQVTQGLQKTQNIAYIAVFNKNAKILFQHIYKTGLRAPFLGKSNTTDLSNRLQLSSYIDPDNKQQYLDIIVPVFIAESNSSVYDVEVEADIINLNTANTKTELIGFLQIGLSKQNIYQRSQLFILEILSVSAAIVFIGILLTLLLTRRITSPINTLVQATQSISKGQQIGSMKVKSKDEMGLLAKSFNQMVKELNKYQSEVKHQHETLEKKVVDRTKKLQIATDDANEQTKKAENANKAKSLFLSNMSHELRTPLNAVIGYSELIQLENEGADQDLLNDSINEINKAGRHLLSLVDDILDFSKIEAGKIELEEVEFETAHLLSEVTSLFSQDIKNKGLTFKTLYSDSIPLYIKGDFKRIKQVLINLISNAIKFTSEGQISLQLSCSQTSDNNHSIFYFKVIDTGIGISREQQAIIFDSFSQADISTTRTFGGTGLGLSIVKQLAGLMGGEINLDSDIGQGSTFSFTLPIDLVSEIDLSVNNHSNDTKQFSANILVAEDFQSNQMLISRFLEHHGCSVDVVSNGQKAVIHFKKNHYDLIFMDCQMPTLDGYEATRLIRKYEFSNNTPPIPIIALTAHALKENNEKCLQAGMDSIITKPFSRHDLYQSIEQWIPNHCVINKESCSLDTHSKRNRTKMIYNSNTIEAIDINFLQNNFDFTYPEDQLFIKKLTVIFQGNGKNILDKLQQSIVQENFAEIKGYAHDLKSICANVGAFTLTEQCKTMEQLEMPDLIDKALKLFEKMENEFIQVINDLAHINKLNDYNGKDQ